MSSAQDLPLISIVNYGRGRPSPFPDSPLHRGRNCDIGTTLECESARVPIIPLPDTVDAFETALPVRPGQPTDVLQVESALEILQESFETLGVNLLGNAIDDTYNHE